LPSVYTGAISYTILPGHGSNATHWTLSVLCKGCSSWTVPAAKSISPSGTAIPLAWAMSSKAVAAAADPGSSFSVHDNKAKFTFDFSAAKAANFDTATKPAAAAA
jgi:hypothetical protein